MADDFKRATKLGRVPPPSGRLNVNFCKNTLYENYCNPETPGTVARGRSVSKREKSRYVVQDKTHQISCLKCAICKKKFATKSNGAVQQEFRRISGDLHEMEEGSCAAKRSPITLFAHLTITQNCF